VVLLIETLDVVASDGMQESSYVLAQID
jgi:hypothetical protein